MDEDDFSDDEVDAEDWQSQSDRNSDRHSIQTMDSNGPSGEDYSEDDQEWHAAEGRDQDDIRRQVDDFAKDMQNIPSDSPSHTNATETGTRARRSEYQFCPHSHRLAILRLFAKHASQHTLLPERHGQPRTCTEIRRDAVTEMYQHCKRNNLREVWAYLWNSWYSPTRWPLWARAANPDAIPRKRTTMVVEALWRNIKRLSLYMFNRPRVDLVVYTIVTRTLPAYRLSFSEIISTSRAGRPQLPSHFQQAYKKSWTRLQHVQIHGSYKTNTTSFTCDCGAQKYHSYLLCKHLVQAAGPIPSSWWTTVRRAHALPFYMLPNISPPDTPDARASRPARPVTPTTQPDRHGSTLESAIVIGSDSDSDVPIPSPSPKMRSSSPVCSTTLHSFTRTSLFALV